MDNTIHLKYTMINHLIVVKLTLNDIYHALLRGWHTFWAEYHFRKEYEARYDKRRRDELKHREAWMKNLTRAKTHHGRGL